MSTTYIEESCPKCKAYNFVCLGNLSDETAVDVEGFRCFNCEAFAKFPEADGEPCVTLSAEEADEFYFEDGKLPPR